MHVIVEGKALASLTEALASINQATGRIHSVFEHAVNVVLILPAGKTRIVTITQQGEYLPDGIQMCSSDFMRVRELQMNESVQWTPSQVSFYYGSIRLLESGWTGSLPMDRSHLRSLLDAFEKQNLLDINLLSSEKTRMKGRLERCIEAIRKNDLDQVVDACWQMVGMGSGLTPSADDALVGALAVLHRVGVAAPAFPEELLARTTDVSAKYLQCAQEGYFSKRMTDLMYARDDLAQVAAIQRVAAWGASSGNDMLWGMRIALQWLIKTKLIETE